MLRVLPTPSFGNLLDNVVDAFKTIFVWLNTFLGKFFVSTDWRSLRILFVIGIAVAVILFVVKLIREVVWGA